MTARAFRGYLYIDSWYDGDTPKGWLAKGGEDYEGSGARPLRFRCTVIDAPEVKGATLAAGLESREWARGLLRPGFEYLCWHYGRDEYGRTLVDPIDPVTGRQFSDLSLAAGMSVPYKR